MSLPETFVPGFHDEAAVRKMPYNAMGTTGWNVSKLGFGGAALGGAALFGEFDEAEAIQMIKEALKKGINYIDTAPYYGQGRSEEILGKALKHVPRKSYYIATKVARYELDITKRFDYSKEKTLWSVDNSLKKLGMDSVDLIQIHDVDCAPTLDIILNETLPTLESVVKAGKAKYIGITGHSVSVLKEVVQRSTVPIHTVLLYARNTLVDDSLLSYIPYFQEKGVAVISAAGLAMALLTNAGPQPWHPASAEVRKTCAQAAQYCKERGVELARLAQYYSMVDPRPATHLVGMNSLEILRSNIDITVNGLSDVENKVLKEIREKFLNKLQGTHWEGWEIKMLEEALKKQRK